MSDIQQSLGVVYSDFNKFLVSSGIIIFIGSIFGLNITANSSKLNLSGIPVDYVLFLVFSLAGLVVIGCGIARWLKEHDEHYATDKATKKAQLDKLTLENSLLQIQRDAQMRSLLPPAPLPGKDVESIGGQV